MAPCTNSARLNVNGAYYGLYVAEESKDATLVAQFFPGNAGGDLFEGGVDAATNKASPNWTRLKQFGPPRTSPRSHRSSTCQAPCSSGPRRPPINDADGYYGGSHNFYIYDLGAEGYTFIPSDVDTTFEWTAALQPAVVQAAPDLLVGRAKHPAVARPALRRRDERSDLARPLRASGGDADREVEHGRDARTRRRVVGADRDGGRGDPRKWATTADVTRRSPTCAT